MKIVHRSIDRSGNGSLKVIATVSEDMWHIYHLLAEGDLITAHTIRKVMHSSNSGSVTTDKILIKLQVRVESIEFETRADAPSNSATSSNNNTSESEDESSHSELRVRGRVQNENQHVKMGQYHTLELALHRPFEIEKEDWDAAHLERIEQACSVSHSAEIAAVLMQPGLANICLVTTHITHLVQKIELSIPKKRVGASTHEQAILRFFQHIYNAIKTQLNIEKLKVVILASPGFLQEDFYSYLMREATRTEDKVLQRSKNKFVTCSSSTGFKHSLKEVLSDPTIASRIMDTKAFEESKALDKFFDYLNTDSERAYYGLSHILYANQSHAIETLLLTDEILRSSDINRRKMIVELMETVKDAGGVVRVFSSLHSSGEQLNQLSGIASILRFPLPEPDDETLDQILHLIRQTSDPKQESNQQKPTSKIYKGFAKDNVSI